MRAQGVEIANTKSSLVDVVTAADREAEQLVAEALRAARPQDGLLGEEEFETHDLDQVSRRSLIDKLLRRYGISAVLTSESRIDTRAGVIVWLARTAPTRARKVRSRLLSWLARA